MTGWPSRSFGSSAIWTCWSTVSETPYRSPWSRRRVADLLDERSRVAPHRGRESHRSLPGMPRLRSPLPGAEGGQRYQRLRVRVVPGQGGQLGLRRRQGRRDAVHRKPGPGVGALRCAGELYRSGHIPRPGSDVPRRLPNSAQKACRRWCRWAVLDWSRRWATWRCIWHRPRPATSPARHGRSTAA